MRIQKILPGLILLGLLVSACTASPAETTATATHPLRLTPYATVTQTPTITPTPINAPTATLVPTATPTPIIYVVKEKDTLGVIAYRNGITVDELKAANPDVDPYMMPVGTKLIIPFHQSSSLTPSPLEATTVPVQILSVECSPAASGGLYCFALVTNSQESPVNNLAAEFHLSDAATGEIVTQQALFPFSQVGAGANLPLYAYFAPPVANQYQVELKVLTASSISGTPVAAGIELHSPQIVLSADGFSAAISGDGVYTETAEKAQTLSITAVSFDDQDKVNGIRRLELPVDISNGSSVTYALNVYSTRGSIARVGVYAETLP